MNSRLKGTAITVLLVGLTGCRFLGLGKVKPEPITTPDPPRPVVVKEPPPKVEPPGPPPKIETEKPPQVPQAVAVIPEPPAPKPKGKRPPKKSTPASQTAVTTLPAPAPAETAPPPDAAVLKLGEILSDEQILQFQRICDESLARAKEALTHLKGLALSPDQKQSVTRIRTFISQAELARQKDPQTARQLAERADLLSRDLVKSVR